VLENKGGGLRASSLERAIQLADEASYHKARVRKHRKELSRTMRELTQICESLGITLQIVEAAKEQGHGREYQSTE